MNIQRRKGQVVRFGGAPSIAFPQTHSFTQSCSFCPNCRRIYRHRLWVSILCPNRNQIETLLSDVMIIEQ